MVCMSVCVCTCVCACIHPGLTGKDDEGSFWSNPNVLYVDKVLGYTGRWSCQISANVRVRFVHFTAYKFQIKRKYVNKYWILIDGMWADVF